MRSYVLAAGVLIAASVSVRADADSRRTLTRLFAEPAAKVTESTVRVRSANKDVALGTVVEKGGYILTKASELRGRLSVRLRDGTEYNAEYIGYDEKSDLALLKIEATDLPAVTFTATKSSMVGNWVAATGSNTEPVAVGVLSAGVRRLYGEENLIDNLNKGYFGILAADPESQAESGVRIREVTPGGAAARAKLKKDDVIIRIADREVKTFPDMKKILESYRPGESVEVLLLRDGEEKTLKVKLSKRSDFDRGDYQNTLGGDLSSRRTGFPEVFSHDTVVAPSDCGGPLVDLDGQVLGINIARAGRVETWTLPANVILKVLPDLKSGKLPPPGKPGK